MPRFEVLQPNDSRVLHHLGRSYLVARRVGVVVSSPAACWMPSRPAFALFGTPSSPVESCGRRSGLRARRTGTWASLEFALSRSVHVTNPARPRRISPIESRPRFSASSASCFPRRAAQGRGSSGRACIAGADLIRVSRRQSHRVCTCQCFQVFRQWQWTISVRPAVPFEMLCDPKLPTYKRALRLISQCILGIGLSKRSSAGPPCPTSLHFDSSTSPSSSYTTSLRTAQTGQCSVSSR